MKRILFAVAVLIFAAVLLPTGLACAQPSGGDYCLYQGKIYHIFFHSLIIDGQKAFSSKNRAGYNDWMTTKDEFKAILPRLYKNGFILVRLTDLVEKLPGGKVQKKELFLPRGKKPLVISVDDVNYYDYMKGEGFAERLAVDVYGRVAAEVQKEGALRLDYEGDVVPILDDFVAKHPDFSLNGAKGVVAVTGYQGVFGYRITTLEGAEKSYAIKQAEQVASRLKASGWTIACHSYTHSIKFRDGSISLNELQADTERWLSKIAPVTGRTPVYISPFGCAFKPSDARFRYLISKGFYIYCPVFKEMTTAWGDDYFISNRLNFDGFTMQRYPERITKYFFNPAEIIDGVRATLAIKTDR